MIAVLVSSATTLALSLSRFILGILLFCVPLPPRDGLARRASLALSALFVLDALLSALLLGRALAYMGIHFALAQLLVFSLLLLAFVAATTYVFDTTIWTALFCCAAGYTVENLASGATELVWSLVTGRGFDPSMFSTPTRLWIAMGCTALVYAATYVLVTRRLMSDGLPRMQDRSLVVLLAMVIVIIIGFDLVIKWLTEQGLAVGAMVLLRLFHGLACLFTLATAFETLVRRQLVADRDTMEHVLAEHERQYEAARGTMTAIDARVHDIRHAIGRLASDEGLPGEAIRDLVRAVDVYDARVQTGNEALDTALTEQGLKLERSGGRLSCIVDGAALSFMSPADTYALLSCLVEALSAEGTDVSLVIRETLGATSLHAERRGSTPPEATLDAVRLIVRRYQGTLALLERDGSCHVNVLFPAR